MSRYISDGRGGSYGHAIDLSNGGEPLAGDRSGTGTPVLHCCEGGPVVAVFGLPRERSGVTCPGCWSGGAAMHLDGRLVAVLVTHPAACPWLAEALAGGAR
jgi:hypothetical protein